MFVSEKGQVTIPKHIRTAVGVLPGTEVSFALVGGNIWIDCIDAGSVWHDWAVDQIQACSERAPLHINLII